MKKTDKFAVIGGQYFYCDYGTTPTLLGAKRRATANREYWDNWHGWHTPHVYAIEDVMEVYDSNGKGLVPKRDAVAVAVWDERKHRWINGDDV